MTQWNKYRKEVKIKFYVKSKKVKQTKIYEQRAYEAINEGLQFTIISKIITLWTDEIKGNKQTNNYLRKMLKYVNK